MNKNGIYIDGEYYVKVSHPKTVRVAGLDWLKDIKIEDKSHYTRLEAFGVAELNDCRLPTIDEFEKLSKCYKKWGSRGSYKGVWFSDNECDLGNEDKSIFFQAHGEYCSRACNGTYFRVGTVGKYISSSIDNEKDQNLCIYFDKYYFDEEYDDPTPLCRDNSSCDKWSVKLIYIYK